MKRKFFHPAWLRANDVRAFQYNGLPARVVFGQGAIVQVRELGSLLGIRRALVISTPEQTDQAAMVAKLLGPAYASSFSGAAMHTPTDVTAAAMLVVEAHAIDGIVAIGGGSSIGLSKAIALRTDLPQLVIPTTYAGSEMTSIIGQTENGLKTTQKTPKVLPETVIYDLDLTLTLPPLLSGVSGINAMAHAVEALYARNGNPVIDIFAERGLSALYHALPIIAQKPHDTAARSDAQYGAWLCAMCLGATDVALHHKLCHVLGGSFDLPHAEVHSIILPHALAYNAPAAPDAIAAIKRAFDGDPPAGRLFDLGLAVGAPMALKDLGMAESGIDGAVEIAMKNPYWNPREIDPVILRKLIAAAWAGERPSRAMYETADA